MSLVTPASTGPATNTIESAPTGKARVPATDSSTSPAHSTRLPAPERSSHAWDRYELPTIALAAVLYAAWAALVWWHASIPGPLLFLAGGYVAQLHFSLQHESIHAMRNLPIWLRTAVVWPPINLWLPYPFYNKGHSTHHVNAHLTHPQKDTETAYHSPTQWQAMSATWRAIYRAN